MSIAIDKLIALAEEMDAKAPGKLIQRGNKVEPINEHHVSWAVYGTPKGMDAMARFVIEARTAWPATAKALKSAVEFIQAEDECHDYRENSAKDRLAEIDRIAAEVLG